MIVEGIKEACLSCDFHNDSSVCGSSMVLSAAFFNLLVIFHEHFPSHIVQHICNSQRDHVIARHPLFVVNVTVCEN